MPEIQCEEKCINQTNVQNMSRKKIYIFVYMYLGCIVPAI